MKKLSELMQLKVDVSNRTIFRVFAIALGFVLAVQFGTTGKLALSRSADPRREYLEPPFCS